jgi:hypothetical protein
MPFFHNRTVIIPRPISTLGLKPSGRYRSLGMITVIKKNKFNFPRRHQTYGYEWSISVEGSTSETPTNLSSLNVHIFQTTINSWAEVTSWGSREACYTLGLKPSGRYRSLGMITVLIWKRACINLWLLNTHGNIFPHNKKWNWYME